MVNKQKGQLSLHPHQALSTCIFKAQVESKHYTELTVSEGPQIVHFTFVALCGKMLSYCHPHKESIKGLFAFMERA